MNKLTFVRLIGRHDAVFLFVVYSLFTVLFVLVDVFSRDYRFAINFWYLGYATYAFARLMEQKQAQGKGLWTLSIMSLIAFIGIYLYSMYNFSVNPHPDRKFPLYSHEVPTNQTIANVTLNITASQNLT